MLYHVSTSIKGLLALSDKDLRVVMQSVKDENGKTPSSVRWFRKELSDAFAKGERFIRADGCTNFDPVKGCLGHPDDKEA